MDDHTMIDHMDEDPPEEFDDEQDNIDEEQEDDDEEVEELIPSNDEGKKEMKSEEIDVCTICFERWTSGGDHRICCLPCGHIYGMSCITKWLLWCQDDGKCPQCKKLCTLKDIRVLYVTRLCVAEEKPHESSSTNFPYTREGLSGFQQYLSSCMDAFEQRMDAFKQRMDALERHAEEVDSSLHVLEQRCNELMGRAGTREQSVG